MKTNIQKLNFTETNKLKRMIYLIVYIHKRQACLLYYVYPKENRDEFWNVAFKKMLNSIIDVCLCKKTDTTLNMI